MTAATRAERIPTLDGWRGVAILAVLASHSRAVFGPGGALEAASIARGLPYLRQGVDLFFAISGFLITRLLLLELTANGRLSLKAFYVRRAFRILPLVFTYLAALQILNVLVGPIAEPWETATTLLFVRNYAMHPGGTATAHFWSLSVEEHFYLFWPPLLALWSRQRALFGACALALVVTMWRAFDARHGTFARIFPNEAGVLFRTDTRLDALLCGAIPAIAWDGTKRLVEKVERAPLTAICALSLVAIPVCGLPLAATLQALLFPALVVSTVFRPSGWAARVLGLPFLRWIGRISYSVYVWQTLFLQVERISFSRTSRGPAQFPLYLLDLGLILLCSLATHHLVEIPLQRVGRKLSATLTRRHAQPA